MQGKNRAVSIMLIIEVGNTTHAKPREGFNIDKLSTSPWLAGLACA